MSKQRFSLFLTLIIVLLIVAGIFAWITGDKSDSAEPQETETVQTSAPAATAEPEKTAAPAPTPAASAEPEETAEPEEEDDPSIPKTRTLNLSGDIDSTTGTNLNISIKWTAVSKNDETVTLTASVYMYSYAMHYGSATGSLSVNGVTENFVTNAVNYDDTDRLQEVRLYTMKVDLPIAVGETGSFPISAVWNFNGVYNNQEINGISVSDHILIEG